MNDFVGTRVAGRFQITRLLGQGGMASVWVATQDAEPHEVAVKVMSPELTADPRFVKRFEREARAASRVQHANTVRIFDCGSDKNLSYIAMELILGSDLAVVLDGEGPMSQRRAAWLIAEVCEALATAHELGVVHRDLKPENVMIVRDAAGGPWGERVKVLDFGIAKMMFEEGTAEEPPDSDNQPTQLTRQGTSLGTPAYMSPEQCQLLEIDPRSDIYTCGILLYQMMTGGVPFEGESPLHTASMHIHEPLTRPGTFAPHLDARFEALIVKALGKKPADRHQSARELVDALRALMPTLPDKPARLGGPPAMRRSNPGRSVPPPAAGAAPMRPAPAPKPATVDAPPDSGDEEAATLMREAPSEAATLMRPAPSEVVRRGTEILDFTAPVASPSAPLAARVPSAPTPELSRVIEAAPRRAPKGVSGFTSMVMGFVVGLVVIGVMLTVYMLTR